MDLLFRTQGKFVRGVKLTVGDHDLNSGERETVYTAFSTQAVFGSAEFRSSNFLNLKENMVLLSRESDYIVRGTTVYKTKLEREYEGTYIYHIDKVEDDAIYVASRN